MAEYRVHIEYDSMITQEGLQKLCELLDEMIPGQMLEITFDYGTQAEDAEGTSYDGDWWDIKVFNCSSSEPLYYFGDGRSPFRALEKCLLQMREGT